MMGFVQKFWCGLFRVGWFGNNDLQERPGAVVVGFVPGNLGLSVTQLDQHLGRRGDQWTSGPIVRRVLGEDDGFWKRIGGHEVKFRLNHHQGILGVFGIVQAARRRRRVVRRQHVKRFCPTWKPRFCHRGECEVWSLVVIEEKA